MEMDTPGETNKIFREKKKKFFGFQLLGLPCQCHLAILLHLARFAVLEVRYVGKVGEGHNLKIRAHLFRVHFLMTKEKLAFRHQKKLEK